VCRKTVNIEVLGQNYFELEGQRIEIIPEVIGDLKYNTVIWIPSIKTLYGSDVLFNQATPLPARLLRKNVSNGYGILRAWKR
jgi:hypothetical protein